MPANFERTPRKRRNPKENTAHASNRGRTPERERANRGRTSERERANRTRTPERERANRTRTPERERVSRAQIPERERTSRARTPERERVSRARIPERERVSRARIPERERVSRGRTPERKRASRARTPERVSYRRTPVRKRIRRRGRAARPGFLSALTRLTMTVLLILAVGRIGSQLLFQELRIEVRRMDEAVPETAAPIEESVSQKKLVSSQLTAVSDPLAVSAPDSEARMLADAQRNRKEGFYTILVAGVDDHNGGSDTVILASVDAKNHKIFGLSIPRDTKAIINGKARKMNAAYKNGGMRLLAETVSEQMSIPVDYTVEVDLEAFAALIDAIGGVDFDVPLDMNYEDPKQNLQIHISKGLQHLDGATALKVVRFRHNSDGTGYGDEDLGRIRTQQNFLKAAAKSAFSFSTLTKIDDMARIVQKYVKTELTLPNLAWLAKEALYAGPEGIQFATLPGKWMSPYIYTDREGALELINAHLNPYKTDRTLEDLHFPS